MERDPPTTPAWSEQKFRALMLHSQDIVSLLDAEGRLLYNSPAAERISGFAPEELAGADTFQYIHPDDRPAVAKAFEALLAGPGATTVVQYRYRTKAGGWTWMEAVGSNQLHDPEVRGIVVNSRDITERRRAEEANAALQAQLLHRQRLEGLGTLAGGIAHDFNNLLAALTANVTLAREGSHDPEVLRELDDARAVLERAAALTRQLLGFARRQPAAPVELDLRAALSRLRPMLERTLGGQIAVVLELPAAPVRVRIDPSQLEQVVVNLATNARDAMPQGGRLTVALSAEPPGGPGQPGAALLRVADDGAGIPPAVLPRVFEPFFTTKEVGRGTGLGLAVTHGIVTQAGGTIQLESAPGAGTTALVRLPLAPPAAAEAHPSAAPPAPPEASRAQPGERVLLADDDRGVRAGTRRLLTWLGWEVDEACDGEEAVALVRRAPGAYAAAVLDVRMPRLGGLAAARVIARLAPSLPVLLVSGYADDGSGLDAAGLAGVLEKPFQAAALGRRLRAAIDGRAAAPAG